MIELALQSTLIFGIAAGANALLRRTSAAQRHAIWMLAFVSVPFLVLFRYVAVPVVPAIPVSVVGRGAALSVAGTGPRSTDYLTPLWTAGTLLLLLRLALSYIWFCHNRDRVTTPLTLGPFRPKIYLPQSAAKWPEGLRQSVMLHEEAHIRRRDTLMQMFPQIACAIVWFQPLAWYAAKRAAEERERASDDLVLASGVEPALYAGHLVDIARESAQIPSVAMGMARTSSLEQRLRALTDRSLSRSVLTCRWRFALVVTLACVVLGVAGLHAQQGDPVYKSGDPGVIGPKVTHKVDAKYSPNAEAQGIMGDVTLSFQIDKDGKPREIKIAESLDPELDKNAVDAFSEWRFSPATKDGKPVVFAAKVKISFKLQ